MFKVSDNIVEWNISPNGTCSDWKFPESNTGLQRLKLLMFRLNLCLKHFPSCDMFRLDFT